MLYELILPAQLSVEGVVERLSRAVWEVLAGERSTLRIYQGHFVAIYGAIHEHLNQTLAGEEVLGGVHTLKFIPDEERDGVPTGLEGDLARAVAVRLSEATPDSGLLDVRETPIPGALREALEPYLWVEGPMGPREP